MAAVAGLVRVLAVVPFFGGTSSATHSAEETRLDYLRQTLESLREFDFTVLIYQAQRDTVDVPGSARLDIDPIHLPYAACVHAQNNHEGAFGWTPELIYVTEADQVLHVHDEDVFKIPNDERYLAPWRLDLVGPNGECELADGMKVDVGDATYSITNGGHHLKADADKWSLLQIHAQQQTFSGAFLCTADYFRRIKFRRMRVLPVEHATGFDAKSTGDCVKTAWVERVWVDHLSPRDRFEVIQ